MMYVTLITTPALQNDTSRLITQRSAIPPYEADASTSNSITKGKNIPERRAPEKEGAAEAGLGYATASGWRRWYPL
jgi:hypothetical protein